MTEPRSCLAPLAPAMRDPDPVAARAAAKQAYHRDGLVVINPAWLVNWGERKQLEILAEKLFGKRRQK